MSESIQSLESKAGQVWLLEGERGRFLGSLVRITAKTGSLLRREKSPMRLIERADSRYGTSMHFRCADTWRLQVNHANDKALNSICFVITGGNGETAMIFA